MIIGCVKEIKNQENRVGLTPAGVRKITAEGHRVLIEKDAGVESGFSNQEYLASGAKVLPIRSEVWSKSDLIVKIKEPLLTEYKFFRANLILFTYLHLAAEQSLTLELMKKQVTAIAYETIEDQDGQLPLLQPMSEVAGKMSVQIGAHYLEKTQSGRGVLLGGVKGVDAGLVTILGSGVVGRNALKVAEGLGARIVLFGRSKKNLLTIQKQYPQIQIEISSEKNISQWLPKTDLLVGAALVAGARAPKLLTKKMISLMPQGSVFVDVSIDQGGVSETSRVTSHSQPVYAVNGVLHYCVPNIPAAVPRTSTLALTQVTLPYLLKLADKGLVKIMKTDQLFAKGVNTYQGKVTNQAVSEALVMKYTDLNDLL